MRRELLCVDDVSEIKMEVVYIKGECSAREILLLRTITADLALENYLKNVKGHHKESKDKVKNCGGVLTILSVSRLK